ncbi:MAG: hypothetical protein R2883_05025 [Caldisericia bacterium]
MNKVDVESVLEGFGKRNKQDLSSISTKYLAEYNPKQKERRGVYYTPAPRQIHNKLSVGQYPQR